MLVRISFCPCKVYSWTSSPELAATAIREAGLAVSITMAFRKAHRPPKPPPRKPIRFIEIGDHGTGNCQSSNIYRPGVSTIDDDHFWLMAAQVRIELAGGIAEAFHRVGNRLQGEELLAFAQEHCGIDRDLERAQAVLDDMRTLTGHFFYAHEFADGAAAMLLDNWSAVARLAEALVEHGRVEGRDVERIIDRALISSASA